MSRPDGECRCGHPQSLHTWEYDDPCSGPGPTHYGCSCPEFRPAAPAAEADLRAALARVEALRQEWDTGVLLSRRFAANELKRALDGEA